MKNIAGVNYQEYQTSSTTSASAAQAMTFNTNNNRSVRALVQAVSDTITFKFGAAGVAASKTVTSGALPANNFTLQSGLSRIIDLLPGQTFYSIIGAAGGGTAIVTLMETDL